MKKLTILIITLFICFSTIGQTSKSIIITEASKTVPTGKKWVLEVGKTTRVQVSYGVLNSGTLCNALFLSSPNMISSLYHGNIYNAEGYIIIFKDYEKVPYTNDYTYDLEIISISDKNLSVNDFRNKLPEEVGVNRIEFKAGESVFVGNCLVSIELMEVNMTQSELLEVKKIHKSKLSNFQIPGKGSRPASDTLRKLMRTSRSVYDSISKTLSGPSVHDSNLSEIVFSSPSVLYFQSDKGWGVDDASVWKLILNVDEFTLQNSNGINKIYYVLKIEKDEGMKMQKFTLGDSEKNITHNLLISWDYGSNQYSLLLNSTDDTEEYQFQEVQSTNKKYQNN